MLKGKQYVIMLYVRCTIAVITVILRVDLLLIYKQPL